MILKKCIAIGKKNVNIIAADHCTLPDYLAPRVQNCETHHFSIYHQQLTILKQKATQYSLIRHIWYLLNWTGQQHLRVPYYQTAIRYFRIVLKTSPERNASDSLLRSSKISYFRHSVYLSPYVKREWKKNTISTSLFFCTLACKHDHRQTLNGVPAEEQITT